jgi:hypothetical protein
MKKILKTLLTLATLALIAASCGEFRDKTSYEFTESEKDLSGTWKILTATRNDVDITSMMDFSKFRLNLNPDGTYTIDNRLPFLVRKDGEWKTDDPRFPFTLAFKEAGAEEFLTSELYYPAVDGKRRINLTFFSAACAGNAYTYVFVREENNL